ncbi:ABC transporter permease subunit [Marixanthomonas sp. SCSIO 43207]|uniref:ABC transporter permease subunit n=1 Tax=Marixanthomonas sp. SCSIO 43207 TaxID=2779360 RepID=UPI001CA8AA5F|nr:ABC transporter permease subunit [Marixanthomonas sp. SCSIO 43207]UAB80962.1 ABC transporter permease subunit [Marixanthomonas sp. SCSIO 43207]
MFETTFDLIVKYKEAFAGGLLVTTKLALISWFLGITIGAFIGVVSSKNKKIIGIPFQIISIVITSVPILVFLFWLHYPAQSILNVGVQPFYTATFMLTIINIIAVSEIVKNGILNLPKQYLEVAKLSGLSKKKQILKIEFPLIIRHILPSILMAQVNILHMSLFASLISVNEIFRVSQRVISLEYKPVEIYMALGIFFLLISLPINLIALYFKKKYIRDISER